MLFTDVNYWYGGAGHRSRIAALVNFLSMESELTVLYLSDDILEEFPTFITYGFHVIKIDPHQIPSDYLKDIKAFLTNKEFDSVIVEYIELSYILDLLDERILTILDTHDLVSQRIKSFENAGLVYHGIRLTHSQELDAFSRFNIILLIQEEDYKSIARYMPADKLLLVPHHVSFSKKAVKPELRNIGFVASEYSPNVEGLGWFIKEVWPVLSCDELILNVYGNVCEAMPEELLSTGGILWHKFIADVEDIYEHCDLMINPVKCGAGLKIKNVEALGNGIPMITTRHAATGLDDNSETNFFLADSSDEFKLKIRWLFDAPDKRKLMAESAYHYAKKQFSAENCFSQLLKKISQRSHE